MELNLGNKKAIVTGGTKGLGRAIAEVFVREGTDVAICARQAQEVTAAAEELRSGGTGVYGQVCDVTDPGQVADFVARSAEALGGIDILVNNAGRAHPGDFETLSDEDWQADLDVKLFSMLRCSRAVVPHMRARGGGRIINVNAVYGRYPDPTFFATSVNRAACLSFTKTLAIQLAPENILVNSSGRTCTADAPPTSPKRNSSASWPSRRFPSAGSAGPTSWPAWWCSWPATGRATSPVPPWTSPGAWESTYRAGVLVLQQRSSGAGELCGDAAREVGPEHVAGKAVPGS